MPDKSGIAVAMYAGVTGHPFTSMVDVIGDATVESRIAYLAHLINVANSKLPKDKNCLKVFLAPEWYFRKPIADGPYTEEERDGVIAGLIARTKSMKGLLIVPGSIYWGKPGAKKTWDVFNSAPVLFEGKQKLLLTKINNSDTFDDKGFRDDAKLENECWAIGANKKLIVDGLFSCEGIDFGLDICMDHSDNVLGRSYVKKHAKGLGVDVHLMISVGQVPSANKCIARHGGYLLQCEGGLAKAAENKAKAAAVYAVQRAEGKTVSDCQKTDALATLGSWEQAKKPIPLDVGVSVVGSHPDRLVIFDDPFLLSPVGMEAAPN